MCIAKYSLWMLPGYNLMHPVSLWSKAAAWGDGTYSSFNYSYEALSSERVTLIDGNCKLLLHNYEHAITH
jgi:hypothetical protein